MSSNSALGVLRLSGFVCIKDLQDFFSCDLSKLEIRKATITSLLEGDRILDNVVITYFKAPNSYTGENLLEISAHGNVLNLKNIMNLFCTRGFSYALPGEFTFRAYRNKKISLSQIEGLDLILRANSSLMLDQGIEVLQGELHQKYLSLQKHFLRFKSALELSVDFLEDVGGENAKAELDRSFANLKSAVAELYKRSSSNRQALLTPTVAIGGKANAGKSSLFNLLLSFNRSIVSSTAGTTRDFVSETIHYKGVDFTLVDTAGLRVSNDSLEQEGMRRAKDVLERAFFKILVLNPFDWRVEDGTLLDSQLFDLTVISHKDCLGFADCASKLPKFSAEMVLSLVQSGSIEPENNGPIEPKDNAPIEPTKVEQIFQLIYDKYLKLNDNNPLLVERHCQIIKRLHEDLEQMESGAMQQSDMGVISSEASIIGTRIQALIGVFSPDDVLANVFENFCIGK